MNLRQLSNFLRIAELQSFTRAANVLNVTQPSLSRQIQLLEQELGVLLFARSDKGAKLTEAGIALRERAPAVLRQVRQMRDEVGVQSNAPKGELSFGLPPSLFDLLTIPAVCAYRERYPEVLLSVSEGISAQLHEAVLTDKLDTAVISDATPLGTLRSYPLLREQLYLVGPKEAELDILQELPLEALTENPLVLTSRPNAMRLIVDSALADVGHKTEPVIEANSSRLLYEMVANGLGFTVLPFSAVCETLRLRRLSLAPVHNLSVTWTVITSQDRGQSVVGRRLRELLRECASGRIAAGIWLGATLLD